MNDRLRDAFWGPEPSGCLLSNLGAGCSIDCSSLWLLYSSKIASRFSSSSEDVAEIASSSSDCLEVEDCPLPLLGLFKLSTSPKYLASRSLGSATIGSFPRAEDGSLVLRVKYLINQATTYNFLYFCCTEFAEFCASSHEASSSWPSEPNSPQI